MRPKKKSAGRESNMKYSTIYHARVYTGEEEAKKSIKSLVKGRKGVA
jgi:hypothetical protein